jgi:hypothetical protein
MCCTVLCCVACMHWRGEGDEFCETCAHALFVVTRVVVDSMRDLKKKSRSQLWKGNNNKKVSMCISWRVEKRIEGKGQKIKLGVGVVGTWGILVCGGKQSFFFLISLPPFPRAVPQGKNKV